MKVGPINIEKEQGHQQWRVSLTIQHMSYYTRWYPSHLYTKQEAIERFMADTMAAWGVRIRPPNNILGLLAQARTALLFLEASEME